MKNNKMPSSSQRCYCGKYITLGEENGGLNKVGYTCPNCTHRMTAKPLTSEEFYEQISRVFGD